MSPSAASRLDGAVRLQRLRSIAGIRLATEVAPPAPAADAVVSTGFAALDAALPSGGWPRGALTEVLCAQPGLLEWRLLAPALARLGQQDRSVVVVAPPADPLLAGLEPVGVKARSLLLVRAQAPAERLWAIEQFLGSGGVGAVLAWLPQVRPEQLRRLHLRADGLGVLLVAFRGLPAMHEASPAPLRVIPRVDQEGSLRLRVFKRSGPLLDIELELERYPRVLQRLLSTQDVQPRAVALRSAMLA